MERMKRREKELVSYYLVLVGVVCLLSGLISSLWRKNAGLASFVFCLYWSPFLFCILSYNPTHTQGGRQRNAQPVSISDT